MIWYGTSGFWKGIVGFSVNGIFGMIETEGGGDWRDRMSKIIESASWPEPRICIWFIFGWLDKRRCL
jgi:hypothetical protein